MATLPTVRLYHPKKGKQIVNASDYARDINWYVSRGWKLGGERRGDASKEEIADSIRESDINKHRAEDPAEQKWRGDKRRAFESRSMKGPGVSTLPPADDTEKVSEGTGEPMEAVEGDTLPARQSKQAVAEGRPPEAETILSLPWFKRRSEVGRITGTTPKNAKEAEKLIADHYAPD